MPVNFLSFSVLLQETPQNTHFLRPKLLNIQLKLSRIQVLNTNFLRHTGIGCTLAFSKAAVSTLPPSFSVFTDSSTGVHSNRFFDNKTILNQFADVLSYKINRNTEFLLLIQTWISVCDLIDFVRIQPHFFLPTSHNRCRKALLEFQGTEKWGYVCYCCEILQNY